MSVASLAEFQRVCSRADSSFPGHFTKTIAKYFFKHLLGIVFWTRLFRKEATSEMQ